MKIADIDKEFLHIFWTTLRISIIIRKDVNYDNVKSHKNQGFTLSLEDMFFVKQQGEEIKLIPQPFYCYRTLISVFTLSLTNKKLPKT